jgi:DNA polymerase
MPRGNIKNANIMFVGMNPGKNENLFGVAFVGRSGKLLDEIIKKLNIKNFFITNICRCWNGTNLPNTKQEIKNCLPNLKFEINCFLKNNYKKHLIISLGKQADLGLSKIFNVNIKTFNIYKINKNLVLCSINHPAYILRNRKKIFNNICFLKKIIKNNLK